MKTEAQRSSDSVACMLIATWLAVGILSLLFYTVLLAIPSESSQGVGPLVGAIATYVFITTIVATFISLIYGLPAFWLLSRVEAANYFSLGLLGALPGVFLASNAPSSFTLSSVVFGVATAVLFFRFKATGTFQ